MQFGDTLEWIEVFLTRRMMQTYIVLLQVFQYIIFFQFNFLSNASHNRRHAAGCPSPNRFYLFYTGPVYITQVCAI